MLPRDLPLDVRRMRPHHIIAILGNRKVSHGPNGYVIVWRWSQWWTPVRYYKAVEQTL